jgi:glutathione S-transferase
LIQYTNLYLSSSYCIAVAASTLILSTWHGLRVGAARRPAKVPYPNAYASAESIEAADTQELKTAKYLLNCAQRAHANYLENLPGALVGILVGGLSYPRFAAAAGLGWAVSRILFMYGYSRVDKPNGSGRMQGSTHYLFTLALWGVLGKQAFDMITA